MPQNRSTDDDVSRGEWLAAHTQTRARPRPDSPARSPEKRVISPSDQPTFADTTSRDEDPGQEARQGLASRSSSWRAGLLGGLVAAGLLVVLSGALAAGIVGLGITDRVLDTGTRPSPSPTAVAVAAILVGVLVVAYLAGGHVAGRLSRSGRTKQGVAVWLIGLLVAGVLVAGVGGGVALLRRFKAGALGQVHLTTMPVLTQVTALSAGILAIAALVASLLSAVVGGKLGCRRHRTVDAAASSPARGAAPARGTSGHPSRGRGLAIVDRPIPGLGQE